MVEGTDSGERVRPDDAEEMSREELLAANRARRAEIKAEVQAKAARPGEPEPEPEPDEAAALESRRSRLVVALAASTAVLAIVAVVLGVLLAGAGSGDDSQAADQRAIAQAKSFATTVLTYSSGDYADLDKRIRQISTPDFADRYIKSSQQAREGNDAAQASGTATATEAGLVSHSDDIAVVLVAVDQKVRSPMVPAVGDGLDYQSRVKITLTRDGDDWKLSDLSVV